MTATEVQARQEEQALSFSPTFTQFTADLNVMLYRIFAILFRQGEFNAEVISQPDKLLVDAEDGTENYDVQVPQINYQGKISQAIEKAQSHGLRAVFQMLQEYVQGTGDTSALDYIDTGKMLKYLYMQSGAPIEVLRKDEDVRKMRDQRDKMQAAAEQMQVAAMGGRRRRI